MSISAHEPCQTKFPFSVSLSLSLSLFLSVPLSPLVRVERRKIITETITHARPNKTGTRVFAALRLLLDIRRSLSATTEGWDSESSRLCLKRSSDAGQI